MESNQGYVIRQSVLFDNGRGFVLAESQTAPAPFVTWQFTVNERGKRDYFWGHYFNDGNRAKADMEARNAAQFRAAIAMLESEQLCAA